MKNFSCRIPTVCLPYSAQGSLSALRLFVYKLKSTGQNLGRVFNARSGRACSRHAHAMQLHSQQKTTYLKVIKLAPKLVGYLALAFALP
jgi:hypothetical protein